MLDFSLLMQGACLHIYMFSAVSLAFHLGSFQSVFPYRGIIISIRRLLTHFFVDLVRLGDHLLFLG